MALPQQIKKVKFDFYSTATLSSGTLTLNDYDITVEHENPLGNPTFSKSLNGFLVPYGVKARVKFDLKFGRMVGTDVATFTTFFNNLITYHNSTSTSLRFYYKWEDNNGATSADYYNVVLQSPIEMVQRYTSQVGKFVPSVTLVGQELITSVPSGLQGL
jgi:hypothetical protein